jgi:hypothetical protein
MGPRSFFLCSPRVVAMAHWRIRAGALLPAFLPDRPPHHAFVGVSGARLVHCHTRVPQQRPLLGATWGAEWCRAFLSAALHAAIPGFKALPVAFLWPGCTRIWPLFKLKPACLASLP